MPGPDLDSDEGRAAYRKELRLVARPLRAGGLALVVGAAMLILLTRQGTPGLGDWAFTLSYVMLGAGWACVIGAIYARNRHHKRRMRQLDVMSS
ncbi:MAG: hypothetical protein KYX67_00725 [Brevundimonas sp.]|uniref:Uncharacterized protein n=1 Tax=Brevundimonas mediterranea TaxID=74329 RepID=A0A7W6EYP8_9CAUL|nr:MULTISPECIES: hypothetical protein [Brevundimonas]MBB3870868.1 hypothetical protein [Brevundimonas mediterranea]MDK2745828.1 hypothetical protein [Brevundimonas sp.]